MVKTLIDGDVDTEGVAKNGVQDGRAIDGDTVKHDLAGSVRLEEVEQLFQKQAKSFLAAHRDEVSSREIEITKLRAELSRVREVLKSLEELHMPNVLKQEQPKLEEESRVEAATVDDKPSGISGDQKTSVTKRQDQSPANVQGLKDWNVLLPDDATRM